MTEETYREAGASSHHYRIDFVLNTLEKRFKNRQTDELEIKDFYCTETAANNYLVIYTLTQEIKRVTRRSIIWMKYVND